MLVQVRIAIDERIEEEPVAPPIIDWEVVPDVQVLGVVGLRRTRHRRLSDGRRKHPLTSPLDANVLV